jgi:hypothetical protein
MAVQCSLAVAYRHTVTPWRQLLCCRLYVTPSSCTLALLALGTAIWQATAARLVPDSAPTACQLLLQPSV